MYSIYFIMYIFQYNNYILVYLSIRDKILEFDFDLPNIDSIIS